MRFLVPLDVRGCADAVIERALWLAKLAPGARIDLMTVMPAGIDGHTDALTVGERQHALGGVLDEETGALLRGFAIVLEKNGVLGDVLARNGRPAEAIIDVCERRRPQMIIMGSHARTGLSRAVFGSVAENVLRHAGCPVLIEPAGRNLEEHPAEAIVQAEAEAAG